MSRSPQPPGKLGRMARLRVILLTAGLIWGPSGCVRRLSMPQVEGDDGESPHTVILYSGVRDGSRRYADYGVVDATILTEDR